MARYRAPLFVEWEKILHVMPRLVLESRQREVQAWVLGGQADAVALVVAFAEAAQEEPSGRFRCFVSALSDDGSDHGSAGEGQGPPEFQLAELGRLPREARVRWFEGYQRRYRPLPEVTGSVIWGEPGGEVDLVVVAASARANLVCELWMRSFEHLCDEGLVFATGPAAQCIEESESAEALEPVEAEPGLFQKRRLVGDRRLAGLASASGVVAGGGVEADGQVVAGSRIVANSCVTSSGVVARAFGSLPWPAMVLDSRGRLIFANSQAEDCFGIGSGEMGAPLQHLREEPVWGRVAAALARRGPSHDPEDLGEIEWPEGSGRYLAMRASHSGEGELAHTVLGFVDGTEAHRLRRQLAESNGAIAMANAEIAASSAEMRKIYADFSLLLDDLEVAGEHLGERGACGSQSSTPRRATERSSRNAR